MKSSDGGIHTSQTADSEHYDDATQSTSTQSESKLQELSSRPDAAAAAANVIDRSGHDPAAGDLLVPVAASSSSTSSSADVQHSFRNFSIARLLEPRRHLSASRVSAEPLDLRFSSGSSSSGGGGTGKKSDDFAKRFPRQSDVDRVWNERCSEAADCYAGLDRRSSFHLHYRQHHFTLHGRADRDDQMNYSKLTRYAFNSAADGQRLTTGKISPNHMEIHHQGPVFIYVIKHFHRPK